VKRAAVVRRGVQELQEFRSYRMGEDPSSPNRTASEFESRRVLLFEALARLGSSGVAEGK
jgi:hypothetical protein